MLPPRFELVDSVESNLQTKYERRCEFGLPSVSEGQFRDSEIGGSLEATSCSPPGL